MWVWTDSTELYHHGINGQKWGQRRFQNPDGSLTPAGRERYGVGEGRKNLGSRAIGVVKGVSKSIETYKTNKVRKANLEKARQAKAEKQEQRKEREELLKTGSAKDILARKSEFTNQELAEAINRLRNEENLKSLLPKEKTFLDKVMDAKAKADKVVGVANTGINIWNTVAKISNSLYGTSMKTIKEQSNDSKEATRAMKEAKQIMDEFKDVALDSISSKELADLVAKVSSINKMEKMAKGGNAKD